VVHRDDADLLASSKGEWFRVLLQLDWRPLCPVAAEYYQGLYESNLKEAAGRPVFVHAESKADAAQRLIAPRVPIEPDPRPAVHWGQNPK